VTGTSSILFYLLYILLETAQIALDRSVSTVNMLVVLMRALPVSALGSVPSSAIEVITEWIGKTDEVALSLAANQAYVTVRFNI
jgi:hypothetical protein